MHPDGTILPIYSRTLSGFSTTFKGPAESNVSAITEDVLNSGNHADGVTSTTFFLGDHLASTQMLTNGGGWPVSSSQFMPFGAEITTGANPNHYKFTGKERDSESGLDYFGSRYYGSSMGRFMSPDWSEEPDPVPYADVENPQTLNLYGYVTNNPLRLYDPTGHAGCCDVLPSMAEVDAGIAYLEGGVETAATVSAGAVVGTIGLIGSQIFAPAQMGNDPAEQRYLRMMGKGGRQNYGESGKVFLNGVWRDWDTLSDDELEQISRDTSRPWAERDRANRLLKTKAKTRNPNKRGAKKPKGWTKPGQRPGARPNVAPPVAPAPEPAPDPPPPPKDKHGEPS